MACDLCARWARVLAALLLAAAISGPAAAQIQLRGPMRLGRSGGAEVDQLARVHLPSDRTSTRGIQRAEESIAAGEYSQALKFLDDTLGLEEDIFVEAAACESTAGLKDTARRLIRDLPPEGRAAYEAAYGPVAERMLMSAVEAGDGAALELVAQRYFYTPAGYEAALLRAMDQADAGDHLAAALTYQQLLDAPEAARAFDPTLSVRAAESWLAVGEEARAKEILDKLVADGRQSITVAGRERRLDQGADALAWLSKTVGEPLSVAAPRLRQWLTYRGNGARNSVASGGLPHMRVRWQVRLLGHPKLESLFDDFAASYQQAENSPPVASAPLAANDYVLVRTPHGLLAVDMKTGKRVWRSEPQRDRELEQLEQPGGGADEEANNPEPARSFARRLWEDYLYGLVSSDGERVFMIRDLPMPMTHEFEISPILGGPPFDESARANRLSAYDLATQGKLVWEIDGGATEGEFSGAFFLGAPLPVGESLFVLTELKSAIYLVALERSTGKPQWRQRLADLEISVALDMRRRLQAALPSYEAGILVCPTGAGLVVGVDLAKRSLAWAYQYDAALRPEDLYRGRGYGIAEERGTRWCDGAAIVADGRVLLTPPESAYLHCVDLRTGKVLWKIDRGEMTRLSCVHEGRILLVGNRRLEAVQLADGKPAWKKPLVLPRGVSPSGSGFVSGDEYYLPLTSGEVTAIDLAKGTITSRAVSREGAPLGNLICHRGSIISQNGKFLECFDQIDVLRQRSERSLAENPRDVEALRTLGEMAYNEGRLSEAIDLLERAHGAAPDDLEVRDVLAECLGAALDEDFASYRAKLPMLKSMAGDGVAQQMLVLRIESQGLLAAGETVAAADACLRLYRLAGPADEMIQAGREHQVTVARWVRAQLAAIWEQADEEARKQLAAELTAEAKQLGSVPAGDGLGRFLEFFGDLPAIEGLKLRRARELADSQQWLEAQQQFLDLAESDERSIAAESVARLSAHLHQMGLHSLAYEFDRRLSGEFADAKCLAGATGRELVAKWSSAAGERVAGWPRGKVEVTLAATSGASAARIRSQAWGLRLERCDEVLGRTTGQISTRSGESVQLSLQDNYGREFFSANLEQPNQFHYRQPSAMYGVSRGNLLVVSLGKQLAAFNTLAGSDGALSPVLWRTSLGSNLDLQEAYFGDGAAMQARPGSSRAPRATAEGKWIGVIGPVTSEGCVWQDQRRLVCVDAISGDERWSRSDVPQGCDLFGDERYVFATPPDETTSLVYSAVDGRYLGKAAIPPWKEQLVTRGRKAICWAPSHGQMELRAVDARSGEVDWRRQFAANAAVDIEMGRYVAVVEPAGRVVVVDAATGEAMVDQPVPAAPRVEEVHLMCGEDSFLVAARHPRPANLERIVRPFNNNLADTPVIDGQLYLFDRDTGRMRWERPAEVVQQALLLTQPADLPFIVFAGVLNNTRDRSGTRAGATLLVLDKATGRTLHYSDELPQPGVGQCVARVTDAAAHQASIEMAGPTILLQFTEGRRPPAPPAMAEVEATTGRKSRGLTGIIFGLGK